MSYKDGKTDGQGILFWFGSSYNNIINISNSVDTRLSNMTIVATLETQEENDYVEDFLLKYGKRKVKKR